MARRSKNWNEGLARDLRNTTFAREFILASVDEGISLQAVLEKVIKAYGVTEFAKKVSMAAPNLLRVVNPKHNPTLVTVNKLLRPFGLRLTVSTVTSQKNLAA